MKNSSPWWYIPTLYLASGFPYIIINSVSTILYADLGYSNELITFWTSWLYLPWVLKMFWSPYIEKHSTKRKWLIICQMILALIFLLIALAIAVNTLLLIRGNYFFFISLFGLLFGAFASATLDIATDGYYLLALSPQKQSYFVGIRTIFYRLAMILGSGILVSAFAALISKGWVSWPFNWVSFFACFGFAFLAFAFWHKFCLPTPAEDAPSNKENISWKEVFASYFNQKNIVYILLFILLYRLGDALLDKIVPLFLLKPIDTGALGLSLEKYGLIKGTLGLGAVIVGNLLGGWLLGKFGFKKCIWPFALILILPNFFYVFMALFPPTLATVATLITLEHFGNGLAMMAFSVFIMYISQGKFKTSHYAISTGIMALGMMFPSMMAGKLQTWLGYSNFFIVIAVISLLTVLVVPISFKIKSIEETEKTFREHKITISDAD